MRAAAVICVVMATVGGCSMAPAPAAADALPPGKQPGRVFAGEERAQGPAPTAEDPLGYAPAPVGLQGGPRAGVVFDRPLGWRPPGQRGGGPWAGRVSGYTVAVVPLSEWRGAPPGWSPPGLDVPLGGGGQLPVVPPVVPDQPAVPGPAGVLGLGVALGWARRIRGRVGR